jgi:hypothetical protein
MTNRPEAYPDRDANDLAAVFDEYRHNRPPRDVVPQQIPPDAPPIPEGPATVTHTEVLTDAETGVPVAADQFTGQAWVAAPITREALKARGIHLR